MAHLEPLVGRRRELAELAAAVADLTGGRGALLLFAGEAGIGKTRLAEETARLAAERGLGVVWGRAWEAGGAPAYWPWIQILRALDPDAAGLLEGQTVDVAATSTDVERFRAFDGVARALAQVAALRPALLVLEDLHSADPASLRLLLHVARLLRAMPLLVIGTYRDLEARLRPGVGELLPEIAREGRTLALRRLDAAEVARLAAERAAALDEARLAEIHVATEGNPLFVVEMLRLIEAEGPRGALALPDGVRAAIRSHLRQVPESAHSALEAAAIVGREFGAAVLGEALGIEPPALAAALEQAALAGLLKAVAPGRYLFAHGLMRDTIVEGLAAARRCALHRRVAEALERLHASDPAAPLAEVAHHWLEAGPDAAERAVDAALAACERAMRQLAFEDAVALAERALAALEATAPGDARRRADVLVRLARARIRAGQWGEGAEAARAAADLARGLGDAEGLASAALTYGTEFQFGRTDPTLVRLLEEALERLPQSDHPLRARCLARLAGALQPAPDPAGPVALAWKAVEMSERLGDKATRLAVLHAGMAAMMDYEDPRRREPLNREHVRLALDLGDRALALRGHGRLVFDALERGDVVSCDAHIADYEALAAEFRQPQYRWPPILFRAMRAFLEGRFAEGWALHEEGRRVGVEAGDANAARGTRLQRLIFHGYEERPAEALRLLDAIPADDPLAPYRPIFRAAYLARAGRVDEAREEWSRVGAEWVAACAHDIGVGQMVAEAALLADDRAAMEAILAGLRACHDRLGHASMAGIACDYPVARGLCLVAHGLGRDDEARAYHDQALALARRVGAQPMIARLQYEWAQLFGAGDRTEAARRLEVARRLAGELGLANLIERLDALGVAPAPRPAAPTRLELVREGEYWTVSGAGEVGRLKDSRGLHMLARLLASPGQEVHVLDLAGAETIDAGDAGELLDGEARAAYRERLEDLRAEVEEAERFADPERARRAREEIDFLAAELARGVGLGGRERRAGRSIERARVNVQRRLSDALKRIQEACPALGRRLANAVRTGTYCSYDPSRSPG